MGYNVIGMWKFRGFTLIEILITIGVMAVLSAGVMTAIGPGPKQAARDGQRRADLAYIASALEIYRSDNRGYPACSSGTSCVPFAITNYLNPVPTDPTTGRNYSYVPAGCSGGFCTSYRLCAALEKETTAIGACTGSCGSGNCSYSVAGP